MRQWQKTLLVIICIAGMGVSFVYHLAPDPDIVGEIKAPVHINIEIDKTHLQDVAVIAVLNRGDTLYRLSPTTELGGPLPTVVLYTNIKRGSQVPFIYDLFLRIPREAAGETLNAIDGISVFIGSKAFYFSHSEAAGLPGLQGKEQGAYILYRLPGLEYHKSFLKNPWINWYGYFNLMVMTAKSFFFAPGKFIVTWIFLICFLVLCKASITNVYGSLLRQNKRLTEMLFLSIIFLAGFALRLNGYARHSLWADELYSASIGANPHLPFLSTFADPGNPPFYFILLRLWFIVFGWSAQAGRLLSVFLGSAAVIPLYFLVKKFSGKKTAFLAALFMAVNTYLIHYSQEARAYILEVFLAPLIIISFFAYMKKPTIANLACYIVPSILLVNTHYYGSFFILANFIFFIAYSGGTKTFAPKKTALLFAGNIIIAFSLIPFFACTALSEALLDQAFNTWIPNPAHIWKELLSFFLLLLVYAVYLRKAVFQKSISGSRRRLLDYSFFVSAAVLLMLLCFSLYRPILRIKYLVIFYPLLLACISIAITTAFQSSSKVIVGLCVFFALAWAGGGYEEGRGDTYQKSQVYISMDAESHPENKSVEMGEFPPAAALYGYTPLPLHSPASVYDVLYYNPEKRFEEEMYLEIQKLGIGPERILRICVDESSAVLKAFP